MASLPALCSCMICVYNPSQVGDSSAGAAASWRTAPADQVQAGVQQHLVVEACGRVWILAHTVQHSVCLHCAHVVEL
jgi:hypothetical protein